MPSQLGPQSGRPIPVLTQSDCTRFWAKVRFTDDRDSCWIWESATMGRYGVFNVRHGLSMFAAHRIAFSLLKGAIPPGLTISHLCHNRLCVRPNHLIAESQKSNILRSVKDRGHPTARLTAADVLDIRKRHVPGYGNQVPLAKEYGVGGSTINDIIHRRTWAHLA